MISAQAPLLATLENPRDGVFAMLNSECVRRDGSDANLLKTLVKRHSRAPGAKEVAGPKSGVFVCAEIEDADAAATTRVALSPTDDPRRGRGTLSLIEVRG